MKIHTPEGGHTSILADLKLDDIPIIESNEKEFTSAHVLTQIFEKDAKLLKLLSNDDREILTQTENGFISESSHTNCFIRIFGTECFCAKDDTGVPAYKDWYVWNGAFWQQDYTTVYRLMEQLIRLRKRLFAGKDSILKHLTTTSTKSTISNAIQGASHYLSLHSKNLNQGNLLPLKNKTINLDTLHSYTPRVTDYLTHSLDFEYDEKADSSEFARFISEIMCHDENLSRELQKALGYSLTTSTKEQCLFLLYGAGANGKSLLLEILQNLFTPYVKRLDGKVFEAGFKDEKNRTIIELHKKRIVIASETRKNGRLRTEFVKSITGDETLTGSAMHKHSVDFMPEFKVWFAFNHYPNLDDLSHSVKRRILIIPFDATFKDQDELELNEAFFENNIFQKDADLKSKLLKNKAGILNYMIEGLRMYNEEGLNLKSDIRVKQANTDYINANDTVKQFIDECCMINAQVNETSKSGDLFKSYEKYCTDNGLIRINQREFKARLEILGFPQKTSPGGAKRYFVGIKLLSETTQEKIGL